jgi:heme/copper-type cytochrome/quinol oxidase subunit 2
MNTSALIMMLVYMGGVTITAGYFFWKVIRKTKNKKKGNEDESAFP